MGIGPLRYNRDDGVRNRVVIGQYGLTPELLQKAGVIKPGAAPLVQALVDQGVPLIKAIPPNLFTGTSGVADVKALTRNVKAQSTAVQTTLKKAQCQLETAGAITGDESPVAIAGVVKAAAVIGTLPTLAAIETTFASFNAPTGKIGPSSGGGGGCPAPHMRILLTDGTLIPAGELKKGMFVKTKHEDTMEEGSFRVDYVAIEKQPRLEIVFDHINFVCSTSHKFYHNGRWLEAKDVTPGTILSGKRVKKVKFRPDGDVVKISIRDAHTYIVEGILSHNKFVAFEHLENQVLSASAGVNPSSALGLTNRAVASAKAQAGQALDAIGSGNLAGKFADQVTSGLGGLKSSLEAKAKAQGLSSIKDAAQGMAASAFASIKDSFPSLPAGIPVNVAEEAKKAAEKATAAATEKLGPASGLTSAISGAGSALKGAVTKAGSDLQGQLSGGLAAAGKSLSGAVSGALPTVGGVSADVGGAKGAAAVLGGAAASVASAAQGAASTLSSTINSAAGSAITAVGTTAAGVTGSLGSPTDAIAAAKGSISSVTQAGAASLASGISNLPGGAGAAGALQNMKTGSNPISKALDGLKSSIKDKATSAINGLKPPNIDAASAALAKAGLPAGLAAQLQSQISSMGSGGGAPVKMAAIALNTTDRGELTAAISSQLGDPGIPAPNLMGEISEVTTGQLEEANKERQKLFDEGQAAFDEFLKADAKRKELMAERDKARETLPQGDPALAAIEAQFQGFRSTWQAAKDKALKANEASQAAARKAEALEEQKAKQDANKPKTA